MKTDNCKKQKKSKQKQGGRKEAAHLISHATTGSFKDLKLECKVNIFLIGFMQSYREIVFVWVGYNFRGWGWGGRQRYLIGSPDSKGESDRCMLFVFFFFNIFAYIYHFIVCIYRRPYRKLIFVIVDLLILFT